MTAISGKNFIAGARCANGTTPHRSVDASTGEALPWTFWQASAEEVDQACDAAAAAAARFRSTSPCSVIAV